MVSSISGGSGSYGAAPITRHQHSKPDPAALATAMFSAIDTKGQGFIDQADLGTALASVSNKASNGQTLSVDDAFKQLDTNGDGKITQQEFADDLKAMFANMQAGGMRPPPPPNDAPNTNSATGLSKDYLTGISSTETNASRKSQLDELIGNFSAIDSNGDQQISAKEVMGYKQAQLAAQNTESATATKPSASQEAEAKLLRMIMQISRSYGVEANSGAAQNTANSVSVKV